MGFQIRSAVLVVVGILFSKKIYDSFYEDFFLDFIAYGLYIGIFVGFLTWSIRSDFRSWRLNGDKRFFLSLAIAIVFTILPYLIHRHGSNRLNQASLMRAAVPSDFNGYHIDLKQDGSYVITNWCMGARYLYGNYRIQDSLIFLDKKFPDKTIQCDHFVISKKYADAANENDLIQCDRKGRELKKRQIFHVALDNRK